MKKIKLFMIGIGAAWVLLGNGESQAAAAGYSLQAATAAASGTSVYAEPRRGAPVIAVLSQGDTYPITAFAAGDEDEVYVRLQLLGGRAGWVRQSLVNRTKLRTVVMGWHLGGSAREQLIRSKKPHLDIVSPRWFTLSRPSGGVSVTTSAEFVRQAHNNGKRVWPLIGNHFDAAATNAFLSRPSIRRQGVAAIRDALVSTGADGINVDFENIDPVNADDFVIFIRELRLAFEPWGLQLSVDVTRTNADPFWSGSYNRAALGAEADYIVMMGYEEHWAGRADAGPVGSVPWVEAGIRELMKEVPSHKILLGVPFYTREWNTVLSTGRRADHSRTMAEAAAIVKARKLKPARDPKSGQLKAEYTAGGIRHVMWLEDQETMLRRYALAKRYRLRGIAAWSLGSETPDIWPVFGT